MLPNQLLREIKELKQEVNRLKLFEIPKKSDLGGGGGYVLPNIGNGSAQYQLLTTGATPFSPGYSSYLLDGTTGGKTNLAVTSGKILTLTSVDNFNLTIPATGTAVLLGAANVFSGVVNPLTTPAESWIGPSATAGVYFKAGNVGIGTGTIPSMLTVAGLINMKNYTVATLPAGTRGDVCYCTDLLLPGFLAVAVGGGAVVGPVFKNATQWVSF
jgi:hypothetical protein